LGEPNLGGGEGGRRQDRQAEVAVDGQLAAGQPLDLGGDPTLLGVPIDETRTDQDRGDQKDDESEQRDSQLLHGGFSLSILRSAFSTGRTPRGRCARRGFV
jgi:hypothetical protein